MGEMVRVLSYGEWRQAIRTQNEDLVEQFIGHGFSVNLCTRSGVPVADNAITSEGYGFNILSTAWACSDIHQPNRKSLIELALVRYNALVPANIKIISMLMRARAIYPENAIFAAVREYNVDILELLVRENRYVLQWKSDDGSTLMHAWACGPPRTGTHITHAQYSDMLRYLMENEDAHDEIHDDTHGGAHEGAGPGMDTEPGIDEYYYDDANNSGNTPVLIAAGKRSQNMIMYLDYRRGKGHIIDVDHRNDDGFSALHVLAGYDMLVDRDTDDTMKSRGDAMLLLLGLGADPMIGYGQKDTRTKRDIENNTPLLRTPAQMLCNSDIPSKEVDNPEFPVESLISELTLTFERYMQTHAKRNRW